MNAKRVTGITLSVIVLLLLAASACPEQTRDAAAEAPRIPGAQPIIRPPAAAPARPAAIPAQTPSTETFDGAVVTQVFALDVGWNAIYLGVEPINPSPLVDGIPEKSVMEAVFADLEASHALDSVWTYTQPVSNKDYIVDPGEGLWDEPGWVRYVPDTNVGPDGESRGFLTTLYTLHANTGYLVKMNASGSVTVSGKPVPGHHRWAAGAYNLAGFPIHSGLTSAQWPTIESFIPHYGPTGDITEVRKLTSDGNWTATMAPTDQLAPGVAYLVRYADSPLKTDYTAPLDVRSAGGTGLPSAGLDIKAGLYSNRVKLLLRNLTASSVDAVLSLPQGAASKVALCYVRGTDEEVDLRTNTPTVTVAAEGEALLEFKVLTQAQTAAGESMLAISASTLGVRWLVPLSSAPTARGGLWVGDVTINDVSQARLGASDERELTVRMAAANSSGVSGVVDLNEVNGTTVSIAMTLTLPAVTTTAETPPEMTAPYVHGRVFVDANQNGKADRTEGGLAGMIVTFGTLTATTLADGAYWLPVSPAEYNIPAPIVPGYTSDFPVYIPSPEITEPPTPPVVTTNQLPASVTIDTLGAIAATPQSYLDQVLPPPYTLPMWDEDGKRVEPKLNFGFVREDQAGIYAGACGGELRDRLYPPPADPPYAVVNGSLTATVPATLADLIGTNTTNNISVLRDGVVIACGDIVVGAPTAFSDGRGSVAAFRIILRVNDDNTVALLPYYALNEKQRVSAANFLSIQSPILIAGPFGQTGAGLVFDMKIPGNDPLNPFKHKYSPDHDNLDRAFAPIESSKLYESYDVDRLITLTLRDLPGDLVGKPLAEAEAAAQSLDWGGAVWGGDYREVLDGLHKNTITVRGTFIIRQMLTFDQLTEQDYDK